MRSSPVLRRAGDIRDGQWHRLHPFTPVLQGGVVAVALITAAVVAVWDGVIFPTLLAFFFGEGAGDTESDLWFWVGESLGFISLGAFAFVLIAGGGFFLQWRVHLVRMDDDVIEVKKGLIVKSSRRARLDRVNTIGIRRPIIPRLLGLAKLDIQAAGNDASVVLAYLPTAVAQGLRKVILTGNTDESDSDLDSGSGSEPGLGAREEEITTREVEVPLFRYLASLVLSVETLVLLAFLTGFIVFAVVSAEIAVLLGLVVGLIGYGVYLGERFLRVGNFVVDSVSGDLRVSLGLLSTSVETIPSSRIHALELSQPWPWKLFGWWRLNANLASQPGASNAKAPEHTVILPVGTLAEVQQILALGIPDLSRNGAGETLQAMVTGPRKTWATPETLVSPRRAHWRVPFSHRATAALHVPGAVLIRRGLWVSRLGVIPLAHIQSASVAGGPWHRALKLRRVEIQSVAGPVALRLSGIDSLDAHQWWEGLNVSIHEAIDDTAKIAPASRPSA
jgi:putative membrane protein